jgi:reverse gyrase
MKTLDREGAAREAGTSVKIVDQLIEKGYIAERDGRLVLTQLGEEAYTDFAKKTGRLRAERIREEVEKQEQEVKVEAPTPSGVQVGLGAYLSPPSISQSELGDAYRMLSDAKAAMARQDHILACRIAYKAFIALLKLVAGVEKGKPKELAKLASAKGVKVAEEEAARAVSIISRISGLTKKMEAGEQLSNEDRVWLESSSQFLVQLVERILLTLENIEAGGVEEGEEGSGSEGENGGEEDAEGW